MADQRVVVAIRITDPNNPSQHASVDALGRLNIVAAGNRSNNTAAPGSGSIGVIPAVATSAAPSYSDGNQVALSTDLAGNLRVIFSTVDVGQTRGPWAVSGTVSVNPHAVFQTAGPWTISGSVTIGNSPDVGQTRGPWAVSGSVSIAGTGITTPVVEGGAVTIATPLATGSVSTSIVASGSTYYLYGADFCSSVPFKVVLETVTNAVNATITTLFGEAGETVEYRPPDRNFIQLVAVGAVNRWTAYFENVDSELPADFYATFYYAMS